MKVEDILVADINKQGYATISKDLISDETAVALADALGLHCCLWITARQYEFRKQPFTSNPSDELRTVVL